jgi:hypothetical protein
VSLPELNAVSVSIVHGLGNVVVKGAGVVGLDDGRICIRVGKKPVYGRNVSDENSIHVFEGNRRVWQISECHSAGLLKLPTLEVHGIGLLLDPGLIRRRGRRMKSIYLCR